MRKSYSTQLRLDSPPIDQVKLNFDCRDSIVPVLRSLQHVYSNPDATEKIMQFIGRDVNGQTSAKRGREGMDYWHILGLAGVRLGCYYTYDQVQDLSENHIKLRAVMGLGSWDEHTEFKWRTIRENVCRLSPQTIDEISRLFVAEGHKIHPEAVEKNCELTPSSWRRTFIIRPRVRSFVTACGRSLRTALNWPLVTASWAGDSISICGGE